jgi:hypothetical protein
MGDEARAPRGGRGEAPTPGPQAQPGEPPAPASPVEEGTRILRGILKF